MMSPNQIPENRSPSHPANFRQTPLQVIHIIGNLMRIWSIYTMYCYLSDTGASVVLFIFSCLLPSSFLLLLLQKPWKGRSLSNTQVVPSLINGGITALYFIMWGKGLKSCGPLRAILGEYAGAVLGVVSAVLYGGRGNAWKKVGGFFAMLASFYFLSQGWAMATQSPFSYSDSPDGEIRSQNVVGVKDMLVLIFAGILSALRRVIARRVSLKNQLKRRLHAITMSSATCFLFPVAMWDMIVGSTSVELPFSAWAFSSFILFGIILTFYVDSIAEESVCSALIFLWECITLILLCRWTLESFRLHIVFSSPRHLMVAGGCIIVMEILYKMDFSLPGFLLCAAILSFGIHEATSLDRTRKDTLQSSDISNGVYEDRIPMSALPS